MGRTIRPSNIERSRRQSTWVSKSPYARRGQPVRTEPERPRHVDGQGQNGVKGQQCPPTSLLPTHGNQVDNMHTASEQIVGKIIASLVPEMKDELIKTVRSMRNSESTSEQGHSDMRCISKGSDQSDSVIVINNQALNTNTESIAS